MIAVHGNVDEPALAERLPERTELDVAPGMRVAVIHDAGPSRGRLARMRATVPDAAAVVFGHSHMPLHERSPRVVRDLQPRQPDRAPPVADPRDGAAEVDGGSIRFRHVEL